MTAAPAPRILYAMKGRHEIGLTRGNETGTDMSTLSRRTFISGLAASTPLLAACGNGVGSSNAARIDSRVDATLSHMYANYPNTRDLADKSTGMLVMPVITEAGLLVGGGYGQGALRIDNATVDYYSATKGSFGPAIRGPAIRPCALFHDRRGAPAFPPLLGLGRGRRS